MLASDACYNDARGINRVVNVLCYPEDVPNGTCQKHVPVHYCVTGGGVAGEYCSLYPEAEVETRSLVKLTRTEVDEIKAAAGSGLVDAYLNSGYVYYVDGSGDGIGWSGFYGNGGGEAPYLMCPEHTQEFIGDPELFPGEDMGWDDPFMGDDFGNNDEFAFPDDIGGWN